MGWINYVKVFNKEKPKKRESWFDPLHINYHWDAVDQMIEKAMQNPSTVKIAKMVESAWLKQWLDREKSPSDAFRFLYLNNAGEQTLASPKFKTWAKYLNDFNQRYPDRKETMIDGIRTDYIDINLIPMLYAAQKDPRTKKLAINLQNALVNKCLVAKEKPADLTWRFSTVTNAEEMIQRYVKKLDAMSTNTS
ncbi:hypothetical protein PC110_g17379 [Phytophthora cactorum]|uniref:RxLR effector PexRD54 WY domain-containing protein n=1 Tax=Phytophthora cactorum TaxID=29920 RepID=A0A329RRD8_9STRA|nr:hypothetical protein PC110_g17379 [Phytophthora cactorum]